MLGAFIESVGELAARPLLFVPALIGMALNAAILLLAVDSYFNVFYSALLLGEVPNASIFDLPFYLLTSYFGDIVVIKLAAFLSLLIGIYLLFTYAALLGGKEKGIVKAMKGQLARIPEMLWLCVFMAAALGIFAVAAFILFIGTISLDGLGIIAFLLLLAWLIFGAYVFIKLAFTPLFMAIGRKKLKEALAESWKWSGGRLLQVAAALVAVGIASWIINAIFSAASDATSVEEIAAVILVLGAAIANAYYNIVLVKYYQHAA